MPECVSVPLRGKGRDQQHRAIYTDPQGEVWVSVPLRGKGRDQRLAASAAFRAASIWFPSPCGEKVGINKEHREV